MWKVPMVWSNIISCVILAMRFSFTRNYTSKKFALSRFFNIDWILNTRVEFPPFLPLPLSFFSSYLSPSSFFPSFFFALFLRCRFFPQYYYRVAKKMSDVMSPLLFFLLLSYAIIIAVFLLDFEVIEEFNIVVYGMMIAVLNSSTAVYRRT